MKVLAAGKSTRPQPRAGFRREPRPRAPRQTWGPWRTRTGHPPAADTRTLGAPAQPGARGRRRRRVAAAAGGERGHMVPAPRAQPARGPAGWRARQGAPLPSSSSSPPLLFPLSFLRDSPSLFSFFFFLSAFFSNRVPGCSLGGAPAARAARKLRPGTGAGAASIC